MKSGFFQSSQVLSEKTQEKTILYPFGKTKITLNGSDFYFNEGVKLPHEIFHELSIRISLEFGFVLHEPFSHVDEIPTDYLEEMFVDSYFNSNIIYLKKQRVDRTEASLIDASIIQLNLTKYHLQIADVLEVNVAKVFPKYIDCITTRSYFYDDLLLFCIHGGVSEKLAILIPFLEKEHLTLPSLKQVATSSIACFRNKLFFEQHDYIETQKYYGVPISPKVHYVEYIFKLMQSYCKAFEYPDGKYAQFGYENIHTLP
jgi:hypothetical protein